MICLRCDSEEFVVKPDAIIEQEFRGEVFSVHTPGMACAKCGWESIALDQVAALRKKTADAYREKHGLLTSAEIVTLRKALKMGQRAFAHFLGVAESSVKRWETWLVQENSSDQLIRVKCAQKICEHLPVLPSMKDPWVSGISVTGTATTQTCTLTITAVAVGPVAVPEMEEKKIMPGRFGRSRYGPSPPLVAEPATFSLSAAYWQRTLKQEMWPNN